MTTLAVADLPRSLSFENQTAARVNPTVAEGSSNEKEVEFGDLDLDGDPDVVMAIGSSDFGERRNKLYFNDGGVFNEASGAPLIPEFSSSDVSRNAFIRDYTGDGWPDIYIINDSNSGGFAGSDKMYVAQHSGGVLTGYSEEGATRIPSGGALGAACGGVSYDFDGDGDWDVYSGNYPGPSQDRGLYNNGTGTLLDVTGTMVPPDGDYTVDVALGDMNGDGKMDLLISNHSTNYIYYNDNEDAGSGPGDFRYAGSTQSLGSAAANENSMETADFDNDGDTDFYWSNAIGNSDRVMRNDGTNDDNEAVLASLNILPGSVTGVTSRKASIADFNDDGRVDVFVANQSGTRPTVLRNTSAAGSISFVDWTPKPAFPNNGAYNGWHAAAFDTNADGDVDLLIGAFSGDHLLENTRANEVTEARIGSTLPDFFNEEPLSVTGTAVKIGDEDAYAATDVGSGFISVVLNGPQDYRLDVLNGTGSVVATSDRGGFGVEEAVQVSTTTGTYTLRVTVVDSTGGACDPPDFDGDCDVDFQDLLTMLASWGCVDCPADLDGGGVGFTDLLILLSAWGDFGGVEYQLEVLGRSG
ncbi:MAG: VCBS repeat-containing protein [Phycisphaerales bacterium]|nr:VCBS repeat-containing protein [Phycisphaerales bacterium]